jgi:manganese/iron transport system substrate-binding protein
VLALIFGCLTSCTATAPNPAGTNVAGVNTGAKRPKVVVTTTILCDMTKEIAGDTLDLNCLLKPGVDGHVYEAVPQDRRAIEDAQLILYSGYNFEPNLVKLIQSVSNSVPKIAVAEAAVQKPLMGTEHDHGESGSEAGNKADNQSTKGEQAPDPHVWQNAANGAAMVKVIENQLAKLAPEKASLYTQNATRLTTELTQIHTWIQSQIATIPASNRKLVTTHDAMGYYAVAYGIPVEGALQGLSTEEKPTANRIKALVREVKASGVPTLFAEVVVNPKLIEAVAKEANVKISDQELYSDSLGEPGSAADTYPKMLIANTKAIVEGLKGQYTAFQLK